MAADCTELLYPCRQALFRAMDPQTRSAWRLVNTQACLDVYESTGSLTCEAPQHSLDVDISTGPDPSSLPVSLLSKCPCLKKLDCAGMDPLQLDALPHGLQLEVLKLANTGMEHCLDFSPLARCCTPEGRQTLQELDLGNNRLGPEGAAVLAPALHVLTGLQRLSLWHNALGVQGAAALAPALTALTGLQRLNLWGNALGPEGVAALVPALKAVTGLQRLNLGENSLGPEGVGALAPALLSLTGLRKLNLAMNGLGPEGAAVLAPALQALTGLKKLTLWHNHLGVQGAAVLVPAVKALSGLHQLDLGNNSLHGLEGAAVTASLIPALQQHNPQLRIII